MFQIYSISQAEECSLKKIKLVRQAGLQILETNLSKEVCNAEKGPFETLSKNLNHNTTKW